ncbi:hypothetical protein EV121DRAFT_264891 [Schizophyllum commune]
MDSESTPPAPTRKAQHTKRATSKHARPTESPAYDASEEDNDPTDDGGAPAPHRRRAPAPPRRHHLASVLSDSDGVDSPTHDGDVESSATAGPDTPTAPAPEPLPDPPPVMSAHPVFITPSPAPVHNITEPAVPSQSAEAFDPSSLTPEDIQAYVQQAIHGDPVSISGETPRPRPFRTNPPPTDRPVRVYADGVYDLFHFAHALQLRQAKLSFPRVHLLVGVCSDVLVHRYKAMTVMTHAERLEAVRHCRWVDEVVADAPWIIDQAFLDKWQIDYVAHDEAPYPVKAGGEDAMPSEDVYAFVKEQGKFLPTRRTPGVSTSDLLERIVTGYRRGEFDGKLREGMRRVDEEDVKQ